MVNSAAVTIIFVMMMMMMLIVLATPAAALTDITPTCFTDINSKVHCTLDTFTGDTAFRLLGPVTYNSLNIIMPGSSTMYDLTLDQLTTDTVSFSGTALHGITFSQCQIKSALGSGTVSSRKMAFVGSTLTLSTSAAFNVNESFQLDTTTVTSTADDAAVVVAPSVSGASVTINANTITHTASNLAATALRIVPASAAVTLSTVSITGNTISETADTTASSARGIHLSTSATGSAPVTITSSMTVTGNTVNVTTALTNIAVTAVDLAATVPEATVSTNTMGASGGASATAFAVNANGGNSWYGTGVNAEATATAAASGAATALKINDIGSGGALYLVSSGLRATASGVALGASFEVAAPTNYVLRLVSSVVVANSTSGASGSAHAYKLPTALGTNAQIFIDGTSSYVVSTVSMGFSSTTPAAPSDASFISLRCSYHQSNLVTATLLTQSYYTFTACGTCNYTTDCNGTTTLPDTVTYTGGQCMCSCLGDPSTTAWLPITSQCPSGLGTTSTTIVPADNTVNEALPYEAVLGLSIFAAGVGMILLILLLCCCFRKYCPGDGASDEEKELEQGGPLPHRDADYDGEVDGAKRIDIDEGGGLVYPGEERADMHAAAAARRPPPPPPKELLDLRRNRYLALRDKRLMDAHLDEIDTLERAGEYERARALRREMLLLRRDNRGRSGPGAGLGAGGLMGVTPSSDQDPDIAVTPSEDGGAAAAAAAEQRDDPLWRERVGLVAGVGAGAAAIKAASLRQQQQQQQQQQEAESAPSRDDHHVEEQDEKIDELQHRVEDMESELHDLEAKLKDISPPSVQHSPGEHVGAAGRGGGVSTKSDDVMYGAAGVPVGRGRGRGPVASAREPTASATPSEEVTYFARPRLSRTSPFRFSETPPMHTKDSVGMIATQAGATGLRVVALRGGSSSDDEQDTSSASRPQRQQQQHRPVAPRRHESPQVQQQHSPPPTDDFADSMSPPDSSVPRRREPFAAALPLHTSPPQAFQKSAAPPQQQQQQQQQLPPPRRGSPLRHTAARFMEKERIALSPQGLIFGNTSAASTSTNPPPNPPPVLDHLSSGRRDRDRGGGGASSRGSDVPSSGGGRGGGWRFT